jgi:hypothetical protein
LAAIAVETELGFKHRLRAVPRRPAVLALEGRRVEEHEPATNGDPEPWELHSELVLVCPEVRERARELLPERDPDAFLARPREPVLLPAGTVDEAHHTTSLPVAVVGYALWRLAETARSALVAVGAVVALALLAQVLH